MKKIFIIVEVPEEKVNTETFYITTEVDIWYNTVKDRPLRPEFTWSKLLRTESQILSNYDPMVEGKRIYKSKD